jgi:IclR family transcriptional regulator, pca regulon regulatory protein
MLSLARGLSVIEAFGEGRTALTIADAARLTGLSRAAVRRCLHTLSTLGYATGASGAYALTPKILTLGHAYLGSTPVARVAQPVLERVSERLHESSSLAVLDADDIVYVARAATQRILSIGLSVGSRLPADCTSMGRILLAFAADAERTRYLARVKLVRHTPRTIVDRGELRAELDRIRSAGYAIVDQELELGLRSLAVPVRRYDATVVAAINVGVHAGRVDAKTLTKDYLPVLQEAAAEIGLLIGYAIR